MHINSNQRLQLSRVMVVEGWSGVVQRSNSTLTTRARVCHLTDHYWPLNMLPRCGVTSCSVTCGKRAVEKLKAHGRVQPLCQHVCVVDERLTRPVRKRNTGPRRRNHALERTQRLGIWCGSRCGCARGMEGQGVGPLHTHTHLELPNPSTTPIIVAAVTMRPTMTPIVRSNS
jgi:hypothetical protein